MSPVISAIHHPVFIHLRGFRLSHARAHYSSTRILHEDLLTVSISDTRIGIPPKRHSVWDLKDRLAQESINDIIGIRSLNCKWRRCDRKGHRNVPVLLNCMLS
jgi:hypothetical protein